MAIAVLVSIAMSNAMAIGSSRMVRMTIPCEKEIFIGSGNLKMIFTRDVQGHNLPDHNLRSPHSPHSPHSLHILQILVRPPLQPLPLLTSEPAGDQTHVHHCERPLDGGWGDGHQRKGRRLPDLRLLG